MMQYLFPQLTEADIIHLQQFDIAFIPTKNKFYQVKLKQFDI